MNYNLGRQRFLCRSYLSVFKKNQYYVMALNTGKANNGHTHEKTSDFFISNCGAYLLNYDSIKQEASGRIIDKLKSMKINTLRLYST